MPASVQNIQEAERLQEEGEGNPWWRDPACVSAELAAVRQQSNVRVGDHMVVTWRRDQGVMEQPTPPAEILSPAPASVTSRQCSSAAVCCWGDFCMGAKISEHAGATWSSEFSHHLKLRNLAVGHQNLNTLNICNNKHNVTNNFV